jgi:hypothetical protein
LLQLSPAKVADWDHNDEAKSANPDLCRTGADSEHKKVALIQQAGDQVPLLVSIAGQTSPTVTMAAR